MKPATSGGRSSGASGARAPSLPSGAGPFCVGALAVADHRANAIGAVLLTCRARVLEMRLLRVAPFAVGFAPPAVVEDATIEVPYAAVRGLARRGRALLLAIDPAVVAPHNRFCLVRFGDRPLAALLSAWAWRLRARMATALVAATAGLGAAALLPEPWASGPVGTAAAALCAAAVAGLAVESIVSRLVLGGAGSDRFRDALESRIACGMGLSPARVTVDVSPEALPHPPADAAHGAASGSWVRAAIAVALATAVGVAALAVVDATGPWVGPTAPVEARAEAEPASLRPGLRTAATLAARVSTQPRDPLQRCSCARADSPLWATGVPSLTFVASAHRGGGAVAPEPDARGVARYDLDLAVVNNGARPQRDVKAVATFARRDGAGKRVDARDRGAFWEGDLLPGRAIKWRFRAPGTEMRLDVDTRGLLGDSESAAPADAFYELATRARLSSVRLHGATMLAYLGDVRAADIVDRLNADGIGDDVTRARIRRAASTVVACDVGVGPPGASTGSARSSVCVYNRGTAARGDLELREVLADPRRPARRWMIDEAVAGREGVRVPLARVDVAPPSADDSSRRQPSADGSDMPGEVEVVAHDGEPP